VALCSYRRCILAACSFRLPNQATIYSSSRSTTVNVTERVPGSPSWNKSIVQALNQSAVEDGERQAHPEVAIELCHPAAKA
jgi:hypothetical protein